MYRVAKWMVIFISVFFVVSSLFFIPPYWNVDKSVWEAIAFMWTIVAFVKALEKLERGESVRIQFRDFLFEFRHEKKKEADGTDD